MGKSTVSVAFVSFASGDKTNFLLPFEGDVSITKALEYVVSKVPDTTDVITGIEIRKHHLRKKNTTLTVTLTVQVEHPSDVNPSFLIGEGSFEFSPYISDDIRMALDFQRDIDNEIDVTVDSVDSVSVENSHDF
jgi:hypothetical protein